MAEFEPDGESLLRAERMASRLMEDLREVSELGFETRARQELFSEQRYSREAEGTPIGDVLENLNQMAIEFSAARRWDGEVVCLKLENGDIVPISWTEIFGGPSRQSYGAENWMTFWDKYLGGPFPFHRIWREGLKQFSSEGDSILITDFRKVVDSVQRVLNGFLSYRFAGMKRWAEWTRGIGMNRPDSPRWPFRRRQENPPLPPLSHGGGLRVRVSCKTLGLRIHVSPAYFINWVYFGSPTSPVISYVLPGRYIFAGDGPMMPKRRTDPTVFCIPADYNPQLKRF